MHNLLSYYFSCYNTDSSPLYSRFSRDRKSTRLNSSHANISYAVFCLKKNKKIPLGPHLLVLPFLDERVLVLTDSARIPALHSYTPPLVSVVLPPTPPLRPPAHLLCTL